MTAFQAPPAPLGTNTESSSPCRGEKKRNLDDYHGVRRDRYALQNVIRGRFIAESDFDGDNPDWEVFNSLPRVVKCKRTRVAPTVGLFLDTLATRAHYSGLHACGSVWTCPICCAQIQEVRRQEIVQAFSWAYSNQCQVDMVTFTVPHYEFDQVRDLLDKLARAFKYLRSGKRYQAFKSEHGYQGNIRSLEVTYGGNGWHPHTHELFLFREGHDTESARAFLLERWEAACQKVGLIPRGKLRAFRKHAIKINPRMDSSDYLAKQDAAHYLGWGGDREITGWMLKQSKVSLHPFQLAAAAGDGDKNAWRLFADYAEAFKGRASIFWSRGLKKLVGVDQVSDEEIADQDNDPDQEPEVIEVGHLDMHAWNQIVDQEGRTAPLEVLEKSGPGGLEKWLAVRGIDLVRPGTLQHIILLNDACFALLDEPPD
jgi:hypothetical protein